MKLQYWNVNGFGNHKDKDELKSLCIRHCLDCVCIFEQKILISSVPVSYWDLLKMNFVIANDKVLTSWFEHFIVFLGLSLCPGCYFGYH